MTISRSLPLKPASVGGKFVATERRDRALGAMLRVLQQRCRVSGAGRSMESASNCC
jgi:hypothetical protein